MMAARRRKERIAKRSQMFKAAYHEHSQGNNVDKF
jgi:hypothetical protein